MKRAFTVILITLMTLFWGGVASAGSISDRDWQGGPPNCC